MNFTYRPAIALCPETGDPELILRPEIPVHFRGASDVWQSIALVDTGADRTVLPKRICEALKISMQLGTGPSLQAFGGQSLPVLFGDIEIDLTDGVQHYQWLARVQFFEFASEDEEYLLLGQVGFLEYFAALFDADVGMLTLTANDRLPSLSSGP